jgi:nicotinamide phosphoribosyltransferase
MSKRGRMTLVRHREYGSYRTVPLPDDAIALTSDHLEPGWEDAMVTVWENGELVRDATFASVRERAAGR